LVEVKVQRINTTVTLTTAESGILVISAGVPGSCLAASFEALLSLLPRNAPRQIYSTI
jgi:hypothetical protein